MPDFPKARPDIIYLCYPNNPTGTVLSRQALQGWVDYARREGCVILYDSAYEAFITDSSVPHSIYELEGAMEVAVEFPQLFQNRWFYRPALRLHGCTQGPANQRRQGRQDCPNGLWNRRQCTKYNGCPYIVQRAAAATYSPEGRSRSWT